MADDSKVSSSNIIVKSEDEFPENSVEDSVGSDTGDENVGLPLKKQKLCNGESKMIFKQEPCTPDNDVNGNGVDGRDNATEDNKNEQPNSSSEFSESVENETSRNRMLRKILNEKKKELLNHPDIVKLLAPK